MLELNTCTVHQFLAMNMYIMEMMDYFDDMATSQSIFKTESQSTQQAVITTSTPEVQLLRLRGRIGHNIQIQCKN